MNQIDVLIPPTAVVVGVVAILVGLLAVHSLPVNAVLLLGVGFACIIAGFELYNVRRRLKQLEKRLTDLSLGDK